MLQSRGEKPGVEGSCQQILDPRIRRTRKLLRDALSTLLATRSFEAISIQDIAEQATVNRATFYAHYADREALLADLIRCDFQRFLEERQVHFDGGCPSALRIVILAVYDFLKSLRRGCPGQHGNFEPFAQSVVQTEVEQVLLEGVRRGEFTRDRNPGLVAATLSWAIYGAAASALRQSPPPDSETFTGWVYDMVLPVLIPQNSGVSTGEHRGEHPLPRS
nr:TetR/AcrR family transcriptional regulator [Paracidobacterium acidisoli]